MTQSEIHAIAEAVREAIHKDFNADAVVEKAVHGVLTSLGLHSDDSKEIRADFAHLRKWRKSVEQAQTFTFRAVAMTLVSGLAAALWMGVKAYLGK